MVPQEATRVREERRWSPARRAATPASRGALALVAAALLLAGLLPAAAPAPAAPAEECFPQVGYCIAYPFLDYWRAHGGLANHGYPLSDKRSETLEDGRAYLVQSFERSRLEDHPANPAP